MKKKKKQPPVRDCSNCGNCEYVGEGAYACMEGPEPVIVMEEHQPTDAFLFCEGKAWDRQ